MEIALIWYGIIGLAVLIYVVLDGFDLGIGILFPFASNQAERDLMMNSIAPVWDGNETWLVLGGEVCLLFFPWLTPWPCQHYMRQLSSCFLG